MSRTIRPISAPRPELAPADRRLHRTFRPPAFEQAPDIAMKAGKLAQLFHRRWSAAVLSELHRGDAQPGGAKFITLANRLRISRETLRDTLIHLIWLQLVRRNTGYGHPMRPEYLLSASGMEVAPACRRLARRIRENDGDPAVRRKWSLPLLLAVGHGATRFGEMRACLPGITPRALTLSLKDLTAAEWVQREVINEFPPGTAYRVTASGRLFLRPLRALAAVAAKIA